MLTSTGCNSKSGEAGCLSLICLQPIKRRNRKTKLCCLKKSLMQITLKMSSWFSQPLNQPIMKPPERRNEVIFFYSDNRHRATERTTSWTLDVSQCDPPEAEQHNTTQAQPSCQRWVPNPRVLFKALAACMIDWQVAKTKSVWSTRHLRSIIIMEWTLCPLAGKHIFIDPTERQKICSLVHLHQEPFTKGEEQTIWERRRRKRRRRRGGQSAE